MCRQAWPQCPAPAASSPTLLLPAVLGAAAAKVVVWYHHPPDGEGPSCSVCVWWAKVQPGPSHLLSQNTPCFQNIPRCSNTLGLQNPPWSLPREDRGPSLQHARPGLPGRRHWAGQPAPVTRPLWRTGRTRAGARGQNKPPACWTCRSRAPWLPSVPRRASMFRIMPLPDTARAACGPPLRLGRVGGRPLRPCNCPSPLPPLRSWASMWTRLGSVSTPDTALEKNRWRLASGDRHQGDHCL